MSEISHQWLAEQISARRAAKNTGKNTIAGKAAREAAATTKRRVHWRGDHSYDQRSHSTFYHGVGFGAGFVHDLWTCLRSRYNDVNDRSHANQTIRLARART